MNTILAALLVSVTLLGVRTASAATDGFTLHDTPGEHLDVLRNGNLIARYMDASDKSKREETYKPYLHVFDAAGQQPITKGPGGTYTHHRGIFIGWMKITVNGKSYDRWHMKGGEQVHEKFLMQSADAHSAAFTSQVRWTGYGAEPILVEERTLKFLPAPAPAYAMIEMTSKLTAVAGETKLDGDPEHAGLQFRPAQEVDGTKTEYIYPKENADPHKDRDYPWVGETFHLRGKQYSVVYLNHPANPKDTPFSAYRDYGRFGGFYRATIPKDGELTLRARFIIIEGAMPSAEWIQKAANEFTVASDPAPKVTVKKAEQPAPPKKKEPAAPVPQPK